MVVGRWKGKGGRKIEEVVGDEMVRDREKLEKCKY